MTLNTWTTDQCCHRAEVQLRTYQKREFDRIDAARISCRFRDAPSNGDDPFATLKGLISDMIARLEEKASEDLNSLVSRSWPEVMNIHPFDAESSTPSTTGFF